MVVEDEVQTNAKQLNTRKPKMNTSESTSQVIAEAEISDGGLNDSDKIAAFDFDGCLANTSAKRVGADAWSLMYDSIHEELQNLYSQGYKLVIFTHETNIAWWKNKRQAAVDPKIGRLNSFIKHVEVSIQLKCGLVFIACGVASSGGNDDFYRKPKPGMWQLMKFVFSQLALKIFDLLVKLLARLEANGLKFFTPVSAVKSCALCSQSSFVRYVRSLFCQHPLLQKLGEEIVFVRREEEKRQFRKRLQGQLATEKEAKYGSKPAKKKPLGQSLNTNNVTKTPFARRIGTHLEATLGAELARYRMKPRVYIGCMKSGPILAAQKGVKYHEPEYWKFREEGNKYFRHATGQLYAISRELAFYISINQNVLHKYVNEDVSLGSWFLGIDVEHVDDRRLCCGTTGMAQTGCARCSSSETPPDELVISSDCGHTFCVECILYLWSRQKDGEAPCICPFDEKKVTWIRPSSIPVPEKINSIVKVYNRLYDPSSPYKQEMKNPLSPGQAPVSWILTKGCTSSPIKTCIEDAITASSTGNFPAESILNTIDERDRIFGTPSYWSGAGHHKSSVPETLLYKLKGDLCVITELSIQPFQGDDHHAIILHN
ncbi:unnamed protein product [Eruca vesicaria subsp. sativa]|uniref:RING-type domain-containing protein n=1 Tax=Eruca vesicaria subsp. sativa TaxID=29727 RepID=A0ABC8JZM5_ERUVS|nr:unnamed protein product [Eruca vesicaria subsp. sativa]